MSIVRDKVNRRQFLKENMSASFRFMTEFLGATLKQDPSVIRPPGSQGEWSFLTTCTRCGDCRSACPQKIIKVLDESSGTTNAYTPYLDLSIDMCTSCGKCAEVCPTDALVEEENPQISQVTFHSERCLTYEGVMCDGCVRECPKNALTISSTGKLDFDESQCNGCAACFHSCIQSVSPFSFYPNG
ncbi:4Fe-4S dicluster domain-containing protein [Salipaludibacillus daqingensis]|uniref:4Fe-4S dicluster domain-containing protein n=1 Tax=Salipaludibacillus daqingensis TaxID=3041001 RepID=UPI002474135B|nr:4Fe-4S dicluster domain-containing protein [Salipaludibacillus daqingensis]